MPFLSGVRTISLSLARVCAVGSHSHWFARGELVRTKGCDCEAKQSKRNRMGVPGLAAERSGLPGGSRQDLPNWLAPVGTGDRAAGVIVHGQLGVDAGPREYGRAAVSGADRLVR